MNEYLIDYIASSDNRCTKAVQFQIGLMSSWRCFVLN